MVEKINELCENIRMHTCSSCGGTYIKHTCRYCGKENEELLHLEVELVRLLSNVTDFNVDMLFSLYTIRDYKIDIVEDIFKRYKFDKYLDSLYVDIVNKKGNYSDFDHRVLFYFADNGMYDKNAVLNILMSELIKDKLNISIDEKLKIIKLFVSNIVYVSTKYTPHVRFKQKENNVIGSSFFGFVDFDDQKIKKWLEEKNYIEILKLVFHECTHSVQKSQMKCPSIPNYFLLIESKEEIIDDIIESYYSDNYLLYSQEVEARYKGITETIAYLEGLGIEVKEKDALLKEAGEEYILSTIEDRKVGGVELGVHDIFDKIVPNINPICLVNYPMIGYEYKIENGMLVRKNKEELDSDYNALSSQVDDNGKQELDRLYSYLYGRLSKEK